MRLATHTRSTLPREFTTHTDARSAKKDVISTKPQKAMGAERREDKKEKKKKVDAPPLIFFPLTLPISVTSGLACRLLHSPNMSSACRGPHSEEVLLHAGEVLTATEVLTRSLVTSAGGGQGVSRSPPARAGLWKDDQGHMGVLLLLTRDR